jgi:hypothetical protein
MKTSTRAFLVSPCFLALHFVFAYEDLKTNIDVVIKMFQLSGIGTQGRPCSPNRWSSCGGSHALPGSSNLHVPG